MKQVSQVVNQINCFRRDVSASVATITVFSIFAVMMAAGVALDYSQIARTQALVAGALDAAVLAAGNDMDNDTEVDQDRFEDFFFANISRRVPDPEKFKIEDFSIDKNTGKIYGRASADVDMTLTRIAGYETVNVQAESTAIYSTNYVEVTMALDVTGSMRGSRINALKEAAANAVNILMPNDRMQRVRVGLVPYSSSVNIGNGRARSLTKRASRSGCVTERPGGNVTDAPYSRSRSWYDRRAKDDCPKAKIEPLTNQKNQLINKIGELQTDGSTAGHLGVAWSYYLLSNNFNGLWPNPSKAAPYSNKVKKVAILMTDGKFNTYYQGVPNNNSPFGRQQDKSNSNAIALCNDMKKPRGAAPGITVYSIVFNARDAQKTLRACATPDSGGTTYFYAPDNAEELNLAFAAIANDIRKLRLSQ